MGRGLNGSMMRAFNSLYDHAEESRRMRKIAQRAMGGPLIRAWNSWLECLDDKEKMRKFARRAMNRGLSRAYERGSPSSTSERHLPNSASGC